MRRAAALFIFLSASGCGDHRPTASDCAKLTDPGAMFDRCFSGDPRRRAYVGDANCLPYSKPERMHGIWAVALESSSFVEGAKAFSPAMLNKPDTWLDAVSMPAEAEHSMRGDRPRAYSVELIGRRALCTGQYGHMGMSPHQVIVTRFLSIRPVRTDA